MWPFKRQPASDSTADRRRAGERVAADWVSCSLGKVMDVSGFGVRIRCELEPPPIGRIVDLTLRYSRRHVTLKGSVVRVRQIGRRSEVGIELLDVEPAIRAELHTLSRQRALTDEIPVTPAQP